MKKLLYLLPLLLLVILSSCDTTDLQFDNHDYVLKYDNEQHYQECECGDIIDTQAHTFSDPIIRLEPTCTNTGIKEYKCTGCEFIKLEDIAALGHIEIIDKAIEVGCENEGLTEGSHCERCNQVLTKQEAIECLGHDYSEFQTVKEATCEGEGLEKKVCNNCSNEVFNTLPAKGHEYTEFITSKEPTCEGEGLEKKTCPNCPSEIFNTLEPKGHTYSDFTTIKNPTCTETGLKSRSCACGHIDYAEIEPKGHTPKDGESLNSTCTEYGHTAPVLCKDCGITLTKEELLPLLDHNYNSGVVIQAPQIRTYGLMEYTCIDCGNIKRERIAKLAVTSEFVVDSISFDNNIEIDCVVGSNDYEIKYIKYNDIEYLYYVDRNQSTYVMKALYKLEYNGVMMLYTHDKYLNTWTHQQYGDSTIFEDFKAYTYKIVNLTVDNFESLTLVNQNTKLYGMITYNETTKNISTELNNNGTIMQTGMYNLFDFDFYYDDKEIVIPSMGNIHSLPEDNKCIDCGMTCFTITDSSGLYAEEYYVYEDLTFAYSAIEYKEGRLPSYFKQEIIKYENTYNELVSYKIKRYLSTDILIYSFLIDSYTYNPETGYLEINYIDAAGEIVDIRTHLNLDGTMEFEIMGSSPYHDYPDSHIGQLFEYRNNKKAYQFRFTENTMVVEVYKTLDLFYIPESNKLFDNIHYGEPDDIFYYYGNQTYYDSETYEFISCSLYIDGLSYKLTIEDRDINIDGTIFDIKCLNHMEIYYYIECENGYSYRVYIHENCIREIREYAPATT